MKKKIKALLQEAELYHFQGLLHEAMGKYINATELIQSNAQLKSRQSLIDGISKKIIALQKEINEIEEAPIKPEVSAKIQDLIKKIFSSSADNDEDIAALEGAIALAKFGQFKRALLEFTELLKKDSVRVVAAKNILRCHMALSSEDDAIAQYKQWLSDDIFLPNQLDKLRTFFESVFKKREIDKTPPQTKTPVDNKEPLIEIHGIYEPPIQESGIEGFEVELNEMQEDELYDIDSIGIKINYGPQKGRVVEFNVIFQSGNLISLVMKSREKDLIENLKIGATLNDVQYCSTIAILNGTGVVSDIKEIKTGPRCGDYCVDIEAVI
jgi:tetratricopeptide (TPR) repeat protein